MLAPERAPLDIDEGAALLARIASIREPLHLAFDEEQDNVGVVAEPAGATLRGTLPPLFPEWLGDRRFAETHGTRYPYVVGEMARGIASEAMVIAAGRADVLAFFGAAGLPLERVESGLAAIAATLDPGDHAWGTNLIHSPTDPALERALVELYLERGVRRASASAFMSLTPNVVRFAASGLRRGSDGRAVRHTRLFAKVSRPEVARLFISPPPREMLAALVSAGELTGDEAAIAAGLPIVEDVTAEADSGGHTDNRPLVALLPSLLALRDELAGAYAEPVEVRIGAAGGLGTPASLAAAFAGGAAYVSTGSVNQIAAESGLSADARAMLAGAGIADTAMAACADMFEQGVKVQVLRRGTMFPMRANRLYELYRSYDALDALPADVRAQLERTIFRASLDEIWSRCIAHFEQSDPAELRRAERDARHRMALVFRWYLGLSSRWPLLGEQDRRLDYQIWCGPALGAFYAWAAGTFLAEPDPPVVEIALNLLEGAAIATRAHQLRTYGVHVPPPAFNYPPRRMTA